MPRKTLPSPPRPTSSPGPRPGPKPHYRSGPRPGWSKTKRLAWERLMANALELQQEREGPYLFLREVAPQAWDTLEADVDVREKKVRVTLMLDESVAKFFRGQGAGYQARINRVLATYAQMKIAEVRESEALYERFRAEEAGNGK